jgi:hypothetical protein
LHKCLFSGTSTYNTFVSVTNPHQFDLNEVCFLGTSGQNIDDLGNFSDAKEKLDYMERNKLLMKENAKLYRRLRILRLKLKEQTVQEAKPIRLETLAEIATSFEPERPTETHQAEISRLVRKTRASSKKP